jgi:predicted ATPase
MVSKKPFLGSVYRKIDLHVHTPRSYDYADKNVSGKDIVDTALKAGLDAIAITDHDHYEFIDTVKQAAVGTDLVVFPGVEISTRDGHLIAILDPISNQEEVRTLLSLCGIGTTKSNPFGTQKTLSSMPIEEVAKVVKNQGGIAVLAHIDGPKGAMTEVGVGKTRELIHGHKAILALELLDEAVKKEWGEGKIYPTIRACIQGSDAHSLSQIGQRHTWVKVSSLDIKGLRQAFKDPEVRVRLASEYNSTKARSYVESLKVSQGFFGTLDVQFNPGLNCFIGGQGVGKSALIEFLRFVLDNISGSSEIKKDHEGKLKHLVQLGGVVSVTIVHSDGNRFAVERTFNPDEGNPLRVQRILEDDSLEDYPITTLSRLFPVLAYSQGEAMSVARDGIKQLGLIDSHIDISGELRNLTETIQQLHDNTRELQQLDSQLEDIEELQKQKDNYSRQIEDLEQQLSRIEVVQKEPAIRDHQAWLDEEQFLLKIQKARDEIRLKITGFLDSINLVSLDIAVPTSKLGHDKELHAVKKTAMELRSVIDRLKVDTEKLFQQNRQQSANAAPDWIAQYRQHIEAHEDATKRVGNIELSGLAQNLKKLKQEFGRIESTLALAKSNQAKKQNLMKTRKTLLTQVDTERGRITTKRRKQAENMTKTLKKRVVISVSTAKNTTEYEGWLHKHLKSREITSAHLQSLLSVKPTDLAQILRSEARDKLKEVTSLSKRVTESVFTYFFSNPECIYELEEIPLEDLPDIRLRINATEYRQLDQLSTGQKFTVIILLSLVDDEQPLIYDQPEDALDTSMIYSDIAQILRRAKDNRQFIFATHNSNMSVGADLDLAIVITATSTDAMVDSIGGLSTEKVRNSLIEYLEGGSEAMRQRLQKLELED